MDSYLSPNVPTVEDELFDYLELSRPDGRERALRLANAAWARIVRYTRRDLTRRVYRTPSTIVCGLTSGDATVTGAGFTALRAYDEVIGSLALRAESRVLSITSDSELELNTPAIATDAAASLTFGSAPLRTSRVSLTEILIPQYPVTEVLAAHEVNADGDLEALDTAGALLEPRTGLYTLFNDDFPTGDSRVAIQCVAGYARPSGLDAGNPEWFDLQEALHRLTAYLISDRNSFRSRASSVQTGPISTSTPDFRMPDDVAQVLRSYVRKW